jgi:hypothetical protein
MSISVAAQAPRNVIACDPGDAEQCKTTIVEGRPMRAMVHEGTSVAVGMPVATDEGNYRVFIRVTQVGPGKAEVRPKHFSGLYSDSEHTRFAFYDKGAEISQRLREANRTQQADGDDALDTPRRGTGSAQSMGRSKAAKLGMRKTDPTQVAAGQDAATGSHAPGVGTIVTPEELYLGQTTLRPGDFAEGFVYFKKPRRLKVHMSINDPLYEIDIPVNGVVFRFN